MGRHTDYMDGIVSRGLKTALRLLSIDDHETLVQKMSQCLVHASRRDPPLREVLSTSAQRGRHDESTSSPNVQDTPQQQREPKHFYEDEAPAPSEYPEPVSVMPVTDPPFAWVTLWGGRYASIYGEYVPKSLRQWGYVIWDKSRLIEMGADESFITGQWGESPDLVKKIKDTFDWSPIEP
jgi:hypothetical protein